jgi:hypothetical protein
MIMNEYFPHFYKEKLGFNMSRMMRKGKNPKQWNQLFSLWWEESNKDED